MTQEKYMFDLGFTEVCFLLQGRYVNYVFGNLVWTPEPGFQSNEIFLKVPILLLFLYFYFFSR